MKRYFSVVSSVCHDNKDKRRRLEDNSTTAFTESDAESSSDIASSSDQAVSSDSWNLSIQPSVVKRLALAFLRDQKGNV